MTVDRPGKIDITATFSIRSDAGTFRKMKVERIIRWSVSISHAHPERDAGHRCRGESGNIRTMRRLCQ